MIDWDQIELIILNDKWQNICDQTSLNNRIFVVGNAKNFQYLMKNSILITKKMERVGGLGFDGVLVCEKGGVVKRHASTTDNKKITICGEGVLDISWCGTVATRKERSRIFIGRLKDSRGEAICKKTALNNNTAYPRPALGEFGMEPTEIERWGSECVKIVGKRLEARLKKFFDETKKIKKKNKNAALARGDKGFDDALDRIRELVEGLVDFCEKAKEV